MAYCLRCGHENVLDVAICEECYALLPGTALLGTTPAEEARPILEGHQRAWQQFAALRELADQEVAVYVGEFEKPIVVQVVGELILGQHAPGSSATPWLDLIPYGAVPLGLSRIHAAIRRTAAGLEIIDLGSTNGTWLNHVALEPYVPTVLCSGAHLRLARMWLTI